MNSDSLVDVVTVQCSWQDKKCFFFPQHPDQFWRLYSSLFYSTRGTVSGSKAAAAWNWVLNSV